MPLLPFYLKHLGVAGGERALAEWQGIIGCAAGLAMAFVAPFWGMLADRFGRRIMVIRSMFAGTIILGLMAFARGPIDLVLLRVAQGAFTGSITASAALVASVVPARHTGLALGMIYGAVSGGMALGPLLAGVLADRFSFRTAYLIGSAILVIAGCLVTVATREDFTPPVREKRRESMSLKVVLLSGGFLLVYLMYFLISFSNWGRATTFPLVTRKLLLSGTPERGLSGLLFSSSQALAGVRTPGTTLNGMILFIAGIAAMCCAPLWGRLGDRWGYRRALIVCCLSTGILAVPVGFAGNVGGLLVWSVLLWMAACGAIPCINAIIREASGKSNIGKAYGLTQSVAAVGWGLGPLFTGYLAGYVDVWASYVLVGGAMAFVPIIAVLTGAQTASSSGPRRH